MDKESVVVWDLPVRIFHWALVISVFTCILTAEFDDYRFIHVDAGLLSGFLVLFRIIWGFVGGKYARFSSFKPNIVEAITYAKSLLALKPIHYVGHNPLGALIIYLLLFVILGTVSSGFVLFQLEIKSFEEIHEGFGEFLQVLVGLHIAGVVVASLIHKEKLIKAMFTGKK